MEPRGLRLLIAAVLGAVSLGAGLASPVGGPPAAAREAGHRHAQRPPAILGTAPLTTFGPPTTTTRRFADGVRLTLHRTGQASWEPTLGVTANGDIYATAWKSLAQTNVLRSLDRGRTWVDVSPAKRGHAVSQDPYLFADGERVFTLDAYALTCGQMSSSEDGGQLWVTNPVACGTVVSDHPSAFAGPPVSSPTIGYRNIVYVCDYRPFGLRSSAYCSKSLNGGLSFVPTGEPAFPVADGSDRCPYELTGHGVADQKGRIYLPRVRPCGPELAISDDEGATWRVVELPDAPGSSGAHEASVAIDRRGNVFYGWMGRDRLPYLTVSTDGARTFSRPRRISPPGVVETNMPALAVNDDGSLAFIYVGSKNAPGPPFGETQPCSNSATECPAAEEYADVTWNGYVAVAEDPLNGRFKTHTINPPSDPIDDEACGPGRCFPLGDFIDVTAGPDGSFWAAFLDGCSKGSCVEFYGAELVVAEIAAR